MASDHPEGTVARPAHIAMTVLADGSVNSSVGVVFDAITPGGRSYRVDVEMALEEDQARAIAPVLSEVFRSAVSREGLTLEPEAVEDEPVAEEQPA